jgi:dTDP-L-rhamnose 4-epimerase
VKYVLISGGAGFIGSSIALKLISKGYIVTILDNLSKQIHGVNFDDSYLYRLIKDKVNFVIGDVSVRSDWEKSIRGQDVIIHLAAETGTGQSMYDIAKYAKVNVYGTSLLLDVLVNKKTNIKKVIVSSSRAVYGEGKYFCNNHGTIYPNERTESDMLNGMFENRCPICGQYILSEPTDEDSKIHPSSIYGITKQVQEQMILLSCKVLNIPAVVYRYQNVYGPGQSLANPYTGILSIFSSNLIHSQPINIFEDGEESRDFVYIDDVVDATILGIENENADYQVFNVGSGEKTSVNKVANSLKELYSSKSLLSITGNFRLGDIRHNYADISKIKKILNFSPQYTFEKGIELFANWVKLEKIGDDNLYQKSLVEMRDKGFFK